MFEIGWSELLVIAVVAIVVVGPKDLPRMMRSFGFYVGKLRRMAGDFQRQFEDAVRESELDEVRKAMQSVREATPSLDLKAPIDKPLMLPQPVPQGHRPWRRRWPRRRAVRSQRPNRARSLKPPSLQRPSARAQKRRSANRHGSANREPRRHRGEQGSLDGASDRAQAPADLVAARGVRGLPRLPLFRQADLQSLCSGPIAGRPAPMCRSR